MATRQTAPEMYEVAYKAHYVTFDLVEAVELYSMMIDEYPGSRQARDARIQLKEIELGIVEIDRVRKADLASAYDSPEKELPTWFRNLLVPPFNEAGPRDE